MQVVDGLEENEEQVERQVSSGNEKIVGVLNEPLVDLTEPVEEGEMDWKGNTDQIVSCCSGFRQTESWL